jgi:type VI secretion system protein ImpC
MQRDDRFRVHLDVDAGRSGSHGQPLQEAVFRLLVIGDFVGAGPRAGSARPVEIDRDTVDEVIVSLRPSVRFALGDGGPEVAAEFESLEDFHPDRLLHRVPLLDALRDLLGQARAGRLAGGSAPAAAQASPAPAASPQPAAASLPAAGGGLLDQILDVQAGPAPAARAAEPPPSDLHGFIRSAIAPHRIHEPDAQQAALTAQVEDTLQSVLRAVLQHPQFQALESAWRGIDMLVRRLETGTRLKVFLLDLPRADLPAAIAERAGDGGAPGLLHAVLTGGRDQGEPWSAIAGLFTFDGSAGDVALLAALGEAARRAGAPFIAAAAPRLGGVASYAAEPDAAELELAPSPDWQALRQSSSARFIGLALPRFLLRQPYDPREEPCEEVKLQEMETPPSHEDYLWGSPALAVALLLGEAFVENGRDMQPGDVLEIGGLPLHHYRDGFETVAKPCAEALITDRVAVRMLDAGLMPLLSQKNGDAVRVAEIQSIAEPAAPLGGLWD